MPFFSNNGAGGLHVEGQIRVFFSVAIACTLATLLVAGFWLQQRPAKTEKGNVLHIEVQEKDAEAAWHEESIGFHKMGSQIS